MNDFLLLLLVLFMYVWIMSTKEDENVFVKLLLNKIRLFIDSVCFMVLCNDSRGIGPKKNPDPDLLLTRPLTNKKTVVFIRHGESDWNYVFNKGINLSVFVRLLRTLIEELLLFGTVNSCFIDSPLNHEGVDQACELSRFLESEAERSNDEGPTHSIIKILAGMRSEEPSIIVSSSLRRAIATTTLSLWSRISKTGEKILILSSLQEISRNVDTFQLSAPHTVADLPFKRIIPHCCGGEEESFIADKIYDATENFGNKTYAFYGIKRLRSFGEWAMKRPESMIIGTLYAYPSIYPPIKCINSLP